MLILYHIRVQVVKFVTGFAKNCHAMYVYSSSGRNMSESSFCHIHVKEPFY